MLVPKPSHFQMLRISVSGTLAAVSVLKPPLVKKIFSAYNKISKINQKQLPDTPGPRELFFMVENMTVPLHGHWPDCIYGASFRR
jgi:hypothetical protein